MCRDSVLPRETVAITGTAVTLACGRGFQWQKALSSFNDLSFGHDLDDAAYGALVVVYGVGRLWESAAHTCFELMRHRRLSPSAATCNSVISTCAKASSWACAAGCLRQQRGGASGASEAVPCNAAVSALERDGRWSDAMALVTEASGRAVQPTIITWNSLLSVCKEGGHWKHALGALRRARSGGAELDIISCNTLADACGAAHQWASAAGWLRSARYAGLRLGATGLNALVDACGQLPDWRRTLAVFGQFRQHAALLDSLSYRVALRSCEKAGRPKPLLDVLVSWPGCVLRQMASGDGVGTRALLHQFALKFASSPWITCVSISRRPFH